MKNIATVVAVSLLVTACTVIPTSFDNVGYDNLVSLKRQAQVTLEACDRPAMTDEVVKLNNITKHNVIYVTNTNEDTAVKNAVVDLDGTVDELVKSYRNGKNPGAVYCVLKLNIINQSADVLVSTVGGRQR